MNTDQFFIKTMDDLKARINSTDEYDNIIISGILRKLLIDGEPLVDLINRKHKLKIRFRINEPEPPNRKSLLVYSIEDGLDPDTSPPIHKVMELNKEKFLSTKVMFIKDFEYSIKDIVKQVAHIDGGVHVGHPNNQKEESLYLFKQKWFLGGAPISMRTLRAIGRIVINSLEPLFSEVSTDLKNQLST